MNAITQLNHNHDASKTAHGSRYACVKWIGRYKDPAIFRKEDVNALLYEARQQRASDIFIQPNSPVLIMVKHRMFALTHRNMEKVEVELILSTITRPTALSEINSGTPVDAVYTIYNEARKKNERGDVITNGFRVSANGITISNAKTVQIVMRVIDGDPPVYSDVGMLESMVLDCIAPSGIIYVAGVTGSGKSTTLAAIIRYILENDTLIKGNIVTHEDPIEYVYDNIFSPHSLICQSQIPTNFSSFILANRQAMRRKPAAILVGELRDSETISSAVEAAMTGHPVYGTVHATDVVSILPRLLSRFPIEMQSQALADIIGSSHYFMAQRLIRKLDGNMLAVREVLKLDKKLKQELLDLSNSMAVIQRIRAIMQDHESLFERQAEQLLNNNVISEHEAQRLTA